MSDDGPGRREVAYRLFAAEYEDASLEYSPGEDERSPNYVVTPTGARVNRLFLVGVLTAVEDVNDEVVRARVVDPTGAFVSYAGQYQPDALGFLERTDSPAFVALTGKARTFQPEGSDRILTSVRPETVTTVEDDTRDRWVVTAAEHTLERVATMAAAMASDLEGDALERALLEAGVRPGLAAGIPLALDHYGTTPAYLAAVRETAVEATRVVAGDVDAVDGPELQPDAERDRAVDLAALQVAPEGATVPDLDGVDLSGPPEASAAEPDAPGSRADADSEAETAEEPARATATSGTTDDAGAGGADTDPSHEDGDGAADEPAGTEDLGDFEPGDIATDEDGDGAPDEGYDLDAEERAEIEAEYGTEFETGTEVDGPGEADIEPEGGVSDDEATATGDVATEDGESAAPDAEPGVEGEPDLEPDTDDRPAEARADDGAGDTTPAEPGDGAGDADAGSGEDPGDDEAAAATTDDEEGGDGEDVDLETAVVDAMAALDDGDGAERTAVVERVAGETGADETAIGEAIQDALMGGQCYEPAEGRLKPI